MLKTLLAILVYKNVLTAAEADKIQKNIQVSKGDDAVLNDFIQAITTAATK